MATLFSKILDGEIPGKIVYQDDQCAAILDIQPQAPKHILLFPKKELRSVSDANAEDKSLLGHLFFTAAQIARQEGLAEKGYRLVVNSGQHAGQTVDHLHIHILGGQRLTMPLA